MTTEEQIKRHERALDILRLIKAAEAKKAIFEFNIANYFVFDGLKEINVHRLEITNKAIYRLKLYYEKI